MIPGEWILCDDPVEINTGRRTIALSVRNTGDRPVQVGSHFHFFEVNRALGFDRSKAIGMRLDLPSGQSVRFEAGDEREVELVEFGGMGRVIGFSGLLDGSLRAPAMVDRALALASARGFSSTGDDA
ncbi:urease subunit beta [Nocardioides sp. YIM 152315]|nr:urease subunit beta [Nocardioides sp. YIM 152315]MDF1603217.1 urease subunit beta [Nocardioides sp. YIM 152315]